MANTTKDGKVYNDKGQYLGSADIVYGTGPIGKNQNKGIVTGLDSQATVNSQPSKNFNSGSNSIAGADPNQPSINNATRREKYAIQNGTPTYDRGASSDIPSYISTPTTPITSTTTQPSTQPATSIIKEKSGSFATEGGDSVLAQIKDIYSKQGIEGLQTAYGEAKAQAYEDLLANAYDMGSLINAQTGVLNTQSPDVQNVIDLMEEVQMARALGYNNAADIAAKLGQDERVIQKIMNNQANELITLNEDYKQRQLRQYYQAEEDLGTQIARNMEDYQNRQRNADYQFNSAIQTLERQLFDSERAAKTSSAIYGMSGTKYTLDRIKTQYQQQMNDLNNTYQYQSATAQLSINRALEDFATNMERLAIEEDEATKALQAQVMETMTNLNNQVGLTVKQQATILANLQTNIARIKSEGLTSSLAALEDGYTTLAEQIAQAYGLDMSDITLKKFTSQELGRTSTSTIGNDTNNLGHILASDDGIRIGTYTSPNGYTYNVYATREDGLLATQGLLQRGYYGKTLKDAAQKWIGQGKDISGAISVIRELGLDPNATLSDENVRQFMEAIGRREGTIKKGETLEQRAAGGNALGGVSTGGISTGEGQYYTGDEGAYQAYLKDGKVPASVKNNSSYGRNETERVTNFVNAARAYQKVQTKESAGNMITSLKELKDLETAWNGLSPTQQGLMGTIGLTGRGETALIGGSNLGGGELSNVYAKYNTVAAQGFIDSIISSKKQGATYGQLSDNEGSKLQAAWSSLTFKDPRNFNTTINAMINNITSNLKELGYTDEEINQLTGTVNLNPQQNATVFQSTGRYGTGTGISSIPGQ